MDNKSLSHVRWKCQYHIVFIPKYRKKVLYGKLKADVRDIISTLCRYKDVEIIDGAVCEDHIHLSVAIPPKYSISKFMGYLKGKSTLMIYRQLENPETVPEISEEKEEESQTGADAQEADSEKRKPGRRRRSSRLPPPQIRKLRKKMNRVYRKQKIHLRRRPPPPQRCPIRK